MEKNPNSNYMKWGWDLKYAGNKNYFVFQMLFFNPLFVGGGENTSHVVDVGAKEQCQETQASILVTWQSQNYICTEIWEA